MFKKCIFIRNVSFYDILTPIFDFSSCNSNAFFYSNIEHLTTFFTNSEDLITFVGWPAWTFIRRWRFLFLFWFNIMGQPIDCRARVRFIYHFKNLSITLKHYHPTRFLLIAINFFFEQSIFAFIKILLMW